MLCDVRTPFERAAATFASAEGRRRRGGRAPRSAPARLGLPRGVPMTGAAGGLAGGLWARLSAELVAGAPFVLAALDFDRGLDASRAVIVGEGRVDRRASREDRRRDRDPGAPDGVPTHAIVGSCALDRFDARILDLQEILEAGDEPAIEAAAATLVRVI